MNPDFIILTAQFYPRSQTTPCCLPRLPCSRIARRPGTGIAAFYTTIVLAPLSAHLPARCQGARDVHQQYRQRVGCIAMLTGVILCWHTDWSAWALRLFPCKYGILTQYLASQLVKANSWMEGLHRAIVLGAVVGGAYHGATAPIYIVWIFR